MCLAKCARVLNQNGLEYTADNMEALMLRRDVYKRQVRAGTVALDASAVVLIVVVGCFCVYTAASLGLSLIHI